jgi:hypothetical protein
LIDHIFNLSEVILLGFRWEEENEKEREKREVKMNKRKKQNTRKR